MIHTPDLELLIYKVAGLRELTRDFLLVRLTMDKGQGSLKISFNLVDLGAKRFKKRQLTKGGKARQSQPLGKFLDSGIERVILAAKVDKLEESHEACRVLGFLSLSLLLLPRHICFSKPPSPPRPVRLKHGHFADDKKGKKIT